MHILLISLFYTPEPVARPHDLALILKKLGHKISVITAYPSYPQGKIYPNFNAKSAKWEEIDGIRVLRVPHLVDRSRSAIRRVLSYVSFSLSAVFYGLLKTEKPDAVWTCQIGFPGVLMSKLRNLPLVHDVQDLWPEWGRATNMGIQSGLYRLLESQERMVYRSAKVIVTITEGFKQELIRKGANSSKIEIIPNWANVEVFHPVNPDPDLAQKEGLSGYFNVIYIGNVGAAQALGVVLDAAAQLQDFQDIRFVIIGDGVERAELEERTHKMGLKNVRFLGSRPQKEAANYMALADVLFLHLQRNRLYEMTVPSKTYGYMACGRPILAAAEGEVANLINGYGLGVVCPPEDAGALAQAIREMRTMPAAQLEQMGRAGYQTVMKYFQRATLGKKYSSVFKAAVKSFQEENN